MSGKKKISDLSQVDISNQNDLFEICTSNNLSKSVSSKTLGEGILGSFTYNNSVSPNENIFMILSNLVLNSASAYNNQTTYNVGHLCTYQSKLYKCIVAIDNPEDFNISHWLRTSVSEVVNQVSNRISAVSDRIDSSLSDLADEYDSTSAYITGDYVIYNDKLYIANQDISVPEDFDDTKWSVTNVTDNLVNEYELPIATNNLLGGIKVGDGLSIDNAGILSTDEIDLSVVENMIAEDFDSTKSYVVGDYCIYDNKLYKCISPISPAYWYKIPKEFSSSMNFTNVSADPQDCYVTVQSNGHWIMASASQNQTIHIAGFSLSDFALNSTYNGTESIGYYNGYDNYQPSLISEFFPNGGYASENAALADLFSRPYFDSSNWTEVTVGDELKSIKEDIPTYTAGDGINIDSNNEISVKIASSNQLGGIRVGDEFKISNTGVLALKQGKDPYDKDLYIASYALSNITDTAQTVNLNLLANPVAIYLQTGYVKDSSGNIYPITDTNYVSISFNGQIATVQAASGLSFTEGGFKIQYTVPELYYVPVVDTTIGVHGTGGTIRYTPKVAQFAMAKTSNWSGDPASIFISLTEVTNFGNYDINQAIYGSLNKVQEYTYNGHTVYYSTREQGSGTSNWCYYQCIPQVMYDSVQTNGLAQFTSVESALKAFIDDYFS